MLEEGYYWVKYNCRWNRFMDDAEPAIALLEKDDVRGWIWREVGDDCIVVGNTPPEELLKVVSDRLVFEPKIKTS